MPNDSPIAPRATAPADSALLEWPLGSPHVDDTSLSGRPIVLAFDGSAASHAATRVADAIGDKLHATVNVVSVVDTTAVPIPFPLDLAMGLAAEYAGGAIHGDQEREVRGQIAAILSRPIEWPASIELGVPAHAIARLATRLNAALVVMGLRHHGRVDRIVNDETALSVMRAATGPVLGVVASATGLPQRALVAMDFSPASIHAAVAAAQLMAKDGWLTLAYVQSMMEYPPGSSDGAIHEMGVQAAFEQVERQLASTSLRVDHVVLHHTEAGAVSHFLLDYAKAMEADLLVAGSARHGRLDRILLGSVSAELVRVGQYSTLIVPPPHE